MRPFFHAVSFLTRLATRTHPSSREEIAESTTFFWLVGALVGAAGGLVAFAVGQRWSTWVAATAAVAMTALMTGALHEDGLADTFDSLGGTTAEKRLAIMDDSRQGTFGTLALVVVTLMKVAALASLAPAEMILPLIVAHLGGRAVAVAVMAVMPAASADGLGATYGGAVPRYSVAINTFAYVVAAIAMLGPTAALAGAGTVLGVGSVAWWAKRSLNGITGDVLGTIEQVTEIAVLLAAV